MNIDRSHQLWRLVILTALAFTLRVYRIDAQDIWGDEAMSIAISALPAAQTLTTEANPPAYFWLLRPLRILWGSSPFALRYLSAIGSTFAAVLIGQIGYEAGGKRLRLWALLMAALSPFLIYYGQEARMYATVVPGAAGSLWLFLRVFNRQLHDKPILTADWAAYTFFALLAVFSHYYAFAVLIVQAVAVLLVAIVKGRWRILRNWVSIWVMMAALFLPFFVVHRRAWGGQTDLRSEEWSLQALWEIGRRTLVAYGLGTTISAEQTPYVLILIAIALLGFRWLLRQQRLNALFLLGAVVGGILFAWAITPLLPFFWERYLLPSLPPFVVLLAAGLHGATAWRKWVAVPLVGVVVALSLTSIGQYHFDEQYLRGGYGQAMALIDVQRSANDIILLNGPLQAALFDYYQPKNMAHVIIPRDQLLEESNVDRWFTDATQQYDRVWLVESGNPAEYDPSGVAKQWLAENGRFALHRDFVGVGIDLFVMGGVNSAETLTSHNFNNEITLTGYTIESPSVTLSDPILLTLFWQAQQPIDNAYTVFTHLVDTNGNIIAQTDRQPVGGSNPTNTWQPDETVIDSYAILLPPDTPPNSYTLQVGLYLWPDLTRLTLPDGTDKATLAEIAVSH